MLLPNKVLALWTPNSACPVTIGHRDSIHLQQEMLKQNHIFPQFSQFFLNFLSLKLNFHSFSSTFSYSSTFSVFPKISQFMYFRAMADFIFAGGALFPLALLVTFMT